jgi:hypothetical protein
MQYCIAKAHPLSGAVAVSSSEHRQQQMHRLQTGG